MDVKMLQALIECLPATHELDIFEYTKLQYEDSIRLLRLYPGTGLSTIVCDLKEYRLSEKPVYKALSYCWGDPSKKFPIHCNGMPIHISSSLATALHYLRLQDSTRLLWIDALCINQNDLPEKSMQVSNMHDIFQQASRVLVWLGEEAKDTSLAIEAIRHLSGLARKAPDSIRSFIEVGTPEHQQYRKFKAASWGVTGLQQTHQKALFNIYRRPWFSRAWVLQEVSSWANGIPPTVFIGRRKVSWEVLCDVHRWLIRNQVQWTDTEDSPSAPSILAGLMCVISRYAMGSVSGGGGVGPSLLNLLGGHINLKSSNEEDIITSLIGLAAPPGSHRLRLTEAIYDMPQGQVPGIGSLPKGSIRRAAQNTWFQYISPAFPAPPVATKYLRWNHKSKVPEYQVQTLCVDYQQRTNLMFEDIVRAIVADELSLDVLLFKISDSCTRMDLPSWVPCWSDMNRRHSEQIGVALEFHASAQTTAWVDPFPQDGLLEVGAVVCDEVKWTSDGIMTCDESDSLILSQLRHLLAQGDAIECYPKENLMDVYWRTLIMDRNTGEGVEHQPAPSQFRSHFLAALVDIQQSTESRLHGESGANEFVTDAELDGHSSGEAAAFFHAAACWSKGRRFFVCKNGFIGVGPPDLQIGDFVMVLKGGALPFVLRARNDASTVWSQEVLARAAGAIYEGLPPDQSFRLSADNISSAGMNAYVGLRPDQIGGPVDSAVRTVETKRLSRIRDFLQKVSDQGEKNDQPRFSLIGCSYVHGLSRGEALAQVTPLYPWDYLFEIGNGWHRVFLV